MAQFNWLRVSIKGTSITSVLVSEAKLDGRTLNSLAAVAEHEREMISQRTRAALQAARGRGVKLGNPTNAEECLEQARAARSAKARQRAENLRPVIDQIVRSGANSFRAKAAALTARGVKTARGSTRWHPEQVAAVLRVTEARASGRDRTLALDGDRADVSEWHSDRRGAAGAVVVAGLFARRDPPAHFEADESEVRATP